MLHSLRRRLAERRMRRAAIDARLAAIDAEIGGGLDALERDGLDRWAGQR